LVRNRTQSVVLIGALSATITAAKLALSFIPNVELVSFLFIMFTLVFGLKRTLIISFTFVTTEILIYGFGTWLLGYYIIWPLLIFLTYTLRSILRNEYHFALLSGAFGLFFGLFFAVYMSLFYGISYGVGYWIQGLSFDVIHMVSNYIVMVILYKPVLNILRKLY
jgi:hypothetical protein